MILRFNDSGAPVRTLQRDLNKLGSILLVDGDFGPSTRDAVIDARNALKRPGPPEADEALQMTVAAYPDQFPLLTAAGATFIARAEVGGPGQYRRSYCRPCWPGSTSGITIGIGYDLRFVKDRRRFEAEWGDVVPAAAINRLTAAFGTVGSAQLRESLADVTIPLFPAMTVFLKRTLPAYYEQARSIYPEITTLSAPRRTALVSLVYNRGTDLTGDRRREMREIQARLAAGDLNSIAEQFDAMSRLWDPAEAPGLIQRRHDEARLWRAGFSALQLDLEQQSAPLA